MKIQNLTIALSENIGAARVQYLDENSFRLNGQTLKIRDNLVMGPKFAFRFPHAKSMLISLRESGVLPVTDAAITHICNRYRKLAYQNPE